MRRRVFLFLLAATIRGAVAYLFFGAAAVSGELLDGARLALGWPVVAVHPVALPGVHVFLWLAAVAGPHLPLPLTFVYKLIPLLFDSATAVALAENGRFRAGLLYALSPVAVVVCAVYGSWQCVAIDLAIVAMLVLRANAIAGGALLMASIVASPVAVLALPSALLRSARRWRTVIAIAACSLVYAAALWALGRPLHLATFAALLAIARPSPELLLWPLPFLLLFRRERAAIVYMLAAGLVLLFVEPRAFAPLATLAWLAPRAMGTGVLLVVAGVVCAIVCIAQVFQRADEDEPPRDTLSICMSTLAILAVAGAALAAAALLPKFDLHRYQAAVFANVRMYTVEAVDRAHPVWLLADRVFHRDDLPGVDITFIGAAWLGLIAYFGLFARRRPPLPELVPALCIAVVLTLNVCALVTQSARAPSIDEPEYLHAGALMHGGQRLYRDFFEHHSPLLFQTLAALVPNDTTPEFPLLDVPRYLARGRAVIAVAGTVAVLAMAFVAFRIAGSCLAALVAMAAVLGSLQTWFRGVADVRYDPPALMLFWVGLALLLERWQRPNLRAVLPAAGAGLVALAAFWSPKWPLATLVAAIAFLVVIVRGGRRVALIALACLSLFPLIAIAVITRAATIRDYVLFTFVYSIRVQRFFGVDRVLTAQFFHDPYRFCGAPFKGLALAATVILVVAAAVWARSKLDARRFVVLVAIAVAAGIEVRFIAPYPNLWPQVFLMWSFAVAALQGVACAALANAMRERRHVIVLTSLFATALFALHFAWRTTRVAGDPAGGWRKVSTAQQAIAAGGTVWLSSGTHPVGGRDASYYWFGANEHVRFALEATANGTLPRFLPPLTASDLPPCRVARGADPQVKLLIGGDDIARVEPAARCMQQLIATGKVVPTPIADVWRVR